MNTLAVLAPGMHTLVQDLARPGFGHLGVSACGAADALALRLGNLTLGNPESAAALEMTLLGGRFEFRSQSWFALAGAEFVAHLDGAPVPFWTPVEARAGQILAIGGSRSGARCYLCLRGGVDVPPVLGSRSTHVPSALGGLDGRALRAGDILPIGAGPSTWTPRPLLRDILHRLRADSPALRITAAAHTARFPAPSLEQLVEQTWTVQNDSNRMGVRLTGTPLDSPGSGSMTTEGAPLGSIQVTGSGEPVILFVDHQTTGGYPKIGCVVSADFWRIGQLRPRAQLRFERISLEHARELRLEQERLLQPEVLFE
jgi:antagonist of KipI